MKRDSKKVLYESIMMSVAKEVKRILNEDNDKQPAQIIAGFSGIGKSYFIEKYKKYGILDYDDYTFPKEPENVYKYIKQHQNTAYILLFTDIDLLTYLAEHDVKYSIIIPAADRKEEFMKMYYNRDIKNHLSKEDANKNIKIRSARWENELNDIKNIAKKYNLKLVQLPHGKYFEDAVKLLNNKTKIK